MTKPIVKIVKSLIPVLAMLFAGTASAHASMMMVNTDLLVNNSHEKPASIILAGNSNQNRQDAIDNRNKYNPNAALIGQMLGGAKSLDIDGLGRADVSPRHYAFCVRKYGSYKFEDNTYLQFSGERTQCISPFWNGD